MRERPKCFFYNRKLLKLFLIIILLSFFSLLAFNLKVSASEYSGEIIKVGAYNWEISDEKLFESGAYQEYIKRYLNRLEEVTGLEFDYVKNNTKNKFLEENKLDLIFGMPYDINLAKKFNYINSSVFEARIALYELRTKEKLITKEKNELENDLLKKTIYNKLDLKNKKIAIFINPNQAVKKSIEEKIGVKYDALNLIKYNTLKEAKKAVIDNKADYLLCLAIFSDMNKFKEVCPLVEIKTYLISKDENENLIEKLTDGLQVIKNENSNYNNWLFKIVKKNDSAQICFTSAEQKALNSANKITFYVNKNKPLYYSKDQNGIESGYYARYIKSITKILKKDYQIISVNPLKVSKEVLPGFFCDSVQNFKIVNKLFHSNLLTKTTLKNDVLICINKSNNNIKPGMIYAGDLPSALKSLTNDKDKIIITKNCFESLKLLIEHKTDVAIVNSMLTNYVNGLAKNKNIVIADVKPNFAKSMVAVNGVDINLLTAVDKAISFITEDDIKLYVEQENELHNYHPTLIEQINLKFNVFLIMAVLFFFLILYVIRKLVKSNLKIANLTNKIKEENVIKDRFLARVSHDIRNPLNVVINYAEFGLEENPKESVNHNYFLNIIINAKTLLNFMKNILELQRMDNDIEIQRHIIDLCELKKETENTFFYIAKAKNIDFQIKLKCSGDFCYIKSNSKMIKQILYSLLDNAFKYTPHFGRVLLSIEATLKEEDIIEKFVVLDTGIGINKEFQKKMYENFNIENEEISSESKMGLGLSICEKSVKKLGGNIECDSNPDLGTKFTVIIKEKKPSEFELKEYLSRKINEENFKTIRRNSKKNSKVKILVCEDSIINAEILKKILVEANYEFDWAKNGKIALSKVKKNQYDLILMDFKMPIMTGFQATVEIRKFNKSIPIIGLSASSSEDYQKASNAGINKCIEKPIDKKKLFNVIEEFVVKQ